MVLSSNDKAYLHIDWAENLDIKIPGEVQSAFFSNTFISIHTGYLYSAEDSGGFAALSDCKNHKAEAIHTAIQPMLIKPHTIVDLSWYEKKNVDIIQNSLSSLSSLTGAFKIIN